MSLVADVGKKVFETSTNLDPCTHGIWLSMTALECDEYILLFVDTEGVNAVRQADNIEPIISLIFLISSQLIYNMMHIVMQSDVSQIRYVLVQLKFQFLCHEVVDYLHCTFYAAFLHK